MRTSAHRSKRTLRSWRDVWEQDASLRCDLETADRRRIQRTKDRRVVRPMLTLDVFEEAAAQGPRRTQPSSSARHRGPSPSRRRSLTTERSAWCWRIGGRGAPLTRSGALEVFVLRNGIARRWSSGPRRHAASRSAPPAVGTRARTVTGTLRLSRCDERPELHGCACVGSGLFACERIGCSVVTTGSKVESTPQTMRAHDRPRVSDML